MKILLIGHLGYQTNQFDGQRLKTRTLCNLLSKYCDNVSYYDTEDFRFNKFSIFKMFWYVVRTDKLAYLPAHGNLKYIFPLIWIIAQLCRTEIHYFVVGGWLSVYIKNLPLHRWMLKHIRGIYTETKRLKNELNEWYAMHHVEQFYNFRPFDFQPKEHHVEGKLRLVFMARVCRAKGVDMLFALGDFIICNGLDDQISLDFYGPIAKEDESYFREELLRFDFMHYKEILSSDKIYVTLQEYDALVLPTHYPTEGLPGSVIDSYISGLPVIVTKWNYATEFVENGSTGIIVPFENGQKELNEAVVKLLYDEELLREMKKNARLHSAEFSEETAWLKLKDLMLL